MSTYGEDGDIVMVPVPRSKLGAVYTALGAAYTVQANPATGQSSPAQAEEKVEVYGQGPWSASEIERLATALKAVPAIREFLTRLARQAPVEMTFNEAVEEAGISSNLLRARLGSLSKISKRLFGVTTWPMSVRYVESGGAIYSMDPKIAEWWLEATGQQP
jgi:hypothetical protein